MALTDEPEPLFQIMIAERTRSTNIENDMVLDFTNKRKDGEQWNFAKELHKKEAREEMKRRPSLVIGGCRHIRNLNRTARPKNGLGENIDADIREDMAFLDFFIKYKAMRADYFSTSRPRAARVR